MEFLPNPKQMEYHTGHFLPGSQTKIVLCGTEPGAFLYAQMLQKELKEEAGLSLDILRALCPAESGDIVLCLDQKLEKDHYQLAIEEDKISLVAGSDEALCNGVQTLCQVIQLHGAVSSLPFHHRLAGSSEPRLLYGLLPGPCAEAFLFKRGGRSALPVQSESVAALHRAYLSFPGTF